MAAAEALDPSAWGDWFSDYSVVTDWEREVSEVESVLGEWGRIKRTKDEAWRQKGDSGPPGWSAREKGVGGGSLWSVSECAAQKWSEGLEAPGRASEAEFGGAGAARRFLFSEKKCSTQRRGAALREALRSLFGCWDGAIALAGRDDDTSGLSSTLFGSTDGRKEAAERASRRAGALSVLWTEPYPAVGLGSSQGAWVVRGTWPGVSRRVELVADGGRTGSLKKSPGSPDSAVAALAAELGVEPALLEAKVCARFEWHAHRPDAAWGQTCAWRTPLPGRSSKAADRLRGGVDGETGSGVRRGAPAWGPRAEPLLACRLAVTWRRPMDVADVLEDDDAPFRTLDPEKSIHLLDDDVRDVVDWRLELRLARLRDDTSAPPQPDDFDGLDDTDANATPLALAARKMAALCVAASNAPASATLFSHDLAGCGCPFDDCSDGLLLPKPLHGVAQTLFERVGTLSDQRRDEYLADLLKGDWRPGSGRNLNGGASSSTPSSSAASPGDRLSVLGLRIASLSSVEAAVKLWRAALLVTRLAYERAAADDSDSDSDDSDDSDRDRDGGMSDALVGRRRLDLSEKEAFADAEFGCPLRRALRLVDACGRAAAREEKDAAPPEARQLPPPAYGSDALDAARVAHHDPDRAAGRLARRKLAKLASDMAAYKAAAGDAASLEAFLDDDDRCRGGCSDTLDDGCSGESGLWGDDADEDAFDAASEVWDAVAPTPALEAAALFDPTAEAEQALSRLEAAHPSWIFRQLAASALEAGLALLDDARLSIDPRAADLPSLRGALDAASRTVSTAVAGLLAGVLDHDVGAVPLTSALVTQVVASADALAAAETHLARALSILGRLGKPENPDSSGDADLDRRAFLETLLTAAASGKPLDVPPAQLPAAKRLFFSLGEQPLDKLPSTPDLREYLVWAETPSLLPDDDEPLAHRAYCAVRRNDRGQGDVALALAITLQDC